jgi:hypothetical protein
MTDAHVLEWECARQSSTESRYGMMVFTRRRRRWLAVVRTGG